MASPHPYAHIYLRANGNFGGNYATNAEKWSTGLRVGVVGADITYNAASLQTFVNACATAFVDFHTSANTYVGATCYLTHVTAARIGGSGLYDPPQQETTVSGAINSAGSGTATQPWNTAGVVSLRTANFRGYASNGRFYYPQLVGSLDVTTGRVSSTAVQFRLDKAKILFDAINAAAAAYATNARVIISSSAGLTSAKVTSIRIDERLDSIERRENANPPVWKTATLTP